MNASALPLRPSISATTASAAARLLCPFTVTAAPASASASAMARPILRLAPVTTAPRPLRSLSVLMLRPSHAQKCQIDRTVPQTAAERERGFDTVLRQTTRAQIGRRFRFQLRTRQGLSGSATQMRLAFLDDAAVAQAHADMAGVLVRIGIGRIDLVTHLGSQRPHGGIANRRIGKGIETEIAFDQAYGNTVGRRELGGVAVRRALLFRQRLPQPVHGAHADLADQLGHIVWIDPPRMEAAGA